MIATRPWPNSKPSAAEEATAAAAAVAEVATAPDERGGREQKK
jgi:hypothetical protein